ncbi:DUF202 domain-containing protein [Rhodococcus sp. NPDC003348]
MVKRDPGLANERTALAWQRTALSVMVGAAVIARLVGRAWAPAIVALLAGSALLGAWVFGGSGARYARHAGRRRQGRARSGLPPLTLASAVCLVGAGELIAVLV